MKKLGIIFMLAITAVNLGFCGTVSVHDDFVRQNVYPNILEVEGDECTSNIVQIMNHATEYPNGDNGKSTLNFGFTKSCVWLKFNLSNETKSKKDLLLHFRNPSLELLEIYEVRGDQFQKNVFSDKFKFTERDIAHRDFHLPIALMPEEDVEFIVFVRNVGGALNASMTLWDTEKRYSAIQRNNVLVGMFYGIAFIYILMTFILAVVLKERFYFYYTLFIIIAAFFVFLIDGFSYQYLWPNFPWIQDTIRFVLLNIYLIVTLLFVQNFFGRLSAKSFWMRVIRGIILVLSISSLVSLFYHNLSMNMQITIAKIHSILQISVHSFIFILLVIDFVKRKERISFTFSMTFLVTLVVILFYSLMKFGIVPVSFDTSIIMYVGGLIIMLMFAIVFGMRVRDVILENRIITSELRDVNRKYAFALINGQNVERKRIAEELHDGVGLMMSTLKMKLTNIKSIVSSKNQQKLASVINSVDQSCIEVRALSHELASHTLERYGLIAAIDDLSEETEMKVKVRRNFSLDRMELSKQTIVYQVVASLFSAMEKNNVETIELRIIHIGSIGRVKLVMNYRGPKFNYHFNQDVKQTRFLINNLNGTVNHVMRNIWFHVLDVEFSI